MNTYEREEMLDSLKNGRQALIDSLSGVSEELAARNPGTGRWSILQIVDHVAVVEDYLFGQILSASTSDSPMRNESREARIRERARDRSRHIAAPKEGLPCGQYAAAAEALAHFAASRERTIEFVRDCQGDLRARITTHPVITGPVNCYEMLLMMAAHPFRHAEQIREAWQSIGE